MEDVVLAIDAPPAELKISLVKIERKRSHNDVAAKPGCAWWVFSWCKGTEALNGAIQITTEWADGNDVEAYIKKVYMYKGEGEKPKAESKTGLRKNKHVKNRYNLSIGKNKK